MKQLIIFLTALAALGGSAKPADTLSLAGSWHFQLDRTDAGISGQWFDHALPDKIKLPGSLPTQGIGDDVSTNTSWTGGIVNRSWFAAPEYAPYRRPGNIKVPFWLQPEKYYAGVRPENSALAEFPTDFCSDWQWWYLIYHGGALRLDLLPANLEPIVGSGCRSTARAGHRSKSRQRQNRRVRFRSDRRVK